MTVVGLPKRSGRRFQSSVGVRLIQQFRPYEIAQSKPSELRPRGVESISMNLETLLKDTANTYMTATLAKRVTGDVVQRVPYSSLGAIALASAITGFWLARRHRSRNPSG
jgi:hypothetical protein